MFLNIDNLIVTTNILRDVNELSSYFIDINNIVYIESNKKISGKTFGKKVGFLKDSVIHLE